MIYVFTGNGKGKTTSAVGMGMRAVGAGSKVLMIQFLKTGDSSENRAIKKIKNFKIRSFGRPGFGPYGDKDFLLAKKGWDFLKKEAGKGKYHLIILDEINLVLKFKLLAFKDVLTFLKSRGKKIDVVLTGRYCPKEIIDMADLVTEFKEIKHYFKKGIKAKKGREY